MSRIDVAQSLGTPFILGPNREALTGQANVALAVNTYPAANRALYIPLRLPVTKQLKSVSFWCTTTSGTYDLGLYDGLLTTRLASKGSTSVAASVNTWTPAEPILLEAGVRYYLGMSCSNTTATFLRTATPVAAMRQGGYAQQATAHPLPSTATPAQIATAFCPILALRFVE